MLVPPLPTGSEFGASSAAGRRLDDHHRPRPNTERLNRSAAAARVQSEAEEFVDQLLKRLAGLPGLSLEFRENILVERQSGSHIMMLFAKHHIVNR